jgi:hypothetical protein
MCWNGRPAINTTSAEDSPDARAVRCAVVLRSDHLLETITLSERTKSDGANALPFNNGQESSRYYCGGCSEMYPQQTAVPSLRMPQAGSCPTSTWMKVPTGGVLTPKLLSPQHSTVPVSRRPQL